MKKIFHITASLSFMLSYGQQYIYTGLSKEFDIKASSVLGTTPEQANDGILKMRIEIIKKDTGREQLVEFFSGMMQFQPFSNLNAVRSYVTGLNKDADAPDNDYGDLIVADFNFDGKEDLAVRREEGGNGGPFYNYYLQDTSGKFVIDTYLSGTMMFFPTEINAKSKTLMTLVHANAYQMTETTYKFNSGTGKWKITKQRLLD